jgi:hypothetical protein
MKWLLLLVVLAAAGAGGFYYVHHREQAQREITFVEMKATKARIDLLNKWIDACKNHSAPTKLDGAYDGFSYDKQSDYVSEEQEQEQRYKDLQGRLGTAIGN